MLPDLFHVGPIPIRSYGLLLALSFLLGVLYVLKATKRDGKPFDPYLTVASYLIFFGVLGARLFYVLFHLEEFSGNWLGVINPFANGEFGIAGLNLYGGVLCAIGAAYIYMRLQQMDILETFDYFAPPLALGIGVTRIGCYLNGCCFGLPTEMPWGVVFPPGSIPYSMFGDVHIHPTQLYSSLYGLSLFILLHYVRKRKQFVGQPVAIFFIVEAIFRYWIEALRYYESAMVFEVGGTQITYNQVISLGLFIAGVVMYLVLRRRRAVMHAAVA